MTRMDFQQVRETKQFIGLSLLLAVVCASAIPSLRDLAQLVLAIATVASVGLTVTWAVLLWRHYRVVRADED